MTPNAVTDVVRAIVLHGLPNVAPDWPEEPLGEPEVATLLYVLRADKLSGLAVGALDDGLVLSESRVAQLVDTHAQALATCLELDRALLQLTAHLEHDGVHPIVLKGPALAQLLYDDPSERLYGDIDLLISPADWDQAVTTLVACGHELVYEEPRPGWARRFSKGTVLRTREGWQLDLHRTFVRGPLGHTVLLDDLAQEVVPLQIGGQRLRALSPEAQLLHACFNAALADSPPRWVALRDVCQLLLSEGVDHERALQMARRWRAEVVVAKAIGLVREVLGIDDLPLAGWAERYRPSRWDRVVLTAYDDPRHSSGREAVLSLLALHGLRARFDYAWPLLFPQRSYFSSRYASGADRLRHATRRIRRG